MEKFRQNLSDTAWSLIWEKVDYFLSNFEIYYYYQ